jgi:hypothetical protein
VTKVAKPDASWYDDNTFMLEATSGNDYINLFIDSTFRPGTFRPDSPYYDALIEYKCGKNEDYYANNGSIRITQFDGNNVSGTFSFSVGAGTSKRDVTEGSFTAKVHFYDFADTTSYNDTSLNVARTKRLVFSRKARKTHESELDKNA